MIKSFLRSAYEFLWPPVTPAELDDAEHVDLAQYRVDPIHKEIHDGIRKAMVKRAPAKAKSKAAVKKPKKNAPAKKASGKVKSR